MDGAQFAKILSMTLTTSENKVSSIHALSTLRYDTYGKKMYYDITIDLYNIICKNIVNS